MRRCYARGGRLTYGVYDGVELLKSAVFVLRLAPRAASSSRQQRRQLLRAAQQHG
jgi:hypothetical protein